ncbi:MAG: hypothetical protein IJ088_05875 [Clostridia bacterium]|nr:hypothetical protein [Clostridia bacterium]
MCTINHKFRLIGCLLILFVVCFFVDAVAEKNYTITYSFESSDSDFILDYTTVPGMPELMEKLPKSAKSGSNETYTNLLQGKTFESGAVTWTYERTDPWIKKITGDVKLKVLWIPKEENLSTATCTITYQYEFDGGWRGIECPEAVRSEIMRRFPVRESEEVSQNGNVNLSEINKNFEGVIDTENDGIWKTAGYLNENMHDTFIAGSDAVMKAKWVFEGNKHEVQYLAVSTDESKPFPEKLEKEIQPAVTQTVEKGDWVRAYAPRNLQIPDGAGTWRFGGYTHSFIVGQSEGNCFTGKWTYLENSPQVTYTFVSDTEGIPLPDEIYQYLPIDANSYGDGDVVTPIMPVETSFQSKYASDYSSANVSWRFIGYEPEQMTMAGVPVKFTGKWKMVDDSRTISVLYASADEKEPIPDELYWRARKDFVSVDLTETAEPELPEKKKVFETAVGRWTFDRFVYSKSESNHAAEMYIGYWKFEEKSRELSYSARSLTEGKELPEFVPDLLPAKTNVSARETDLSPVEPTRREIRVTGASWVFRDYQELSVVPGDTPLVFVSEWEYVPDEPVSASIRGSVSLSGKTMIGQEFEFILVEGNDILQQVSNQSDGSFAFTPLQFDADDLARMPENGFEYQVMEVDGGETKDGTLLDGTVQKVTVRLGETESRLTVQTQGTPVFTNAYSAEAMVTVTAKVEFFGFEFVDRTLQPVRMKLFSFELYEKDGGSWERLATSECDGQGKISFEIPVDHLDTGLHCFRIVQAEQGEDHVLRDQRRHDFNLNVIDSGNGTLEVEPVYVGQSVASLQNISVNLPELVFVNRMESELLSVEIDENLSGRNGWQLFANGMPLEVDETIMGQILTETDGEIRLRGLPSYDSDGNRITWSLQLAADSDVQILREDGNVKDSHYAENGETIRLAVTSAVWTGNGFSADLMLSGTDTVPDVRAKLLKDGKASGHALTMAKVDENQYRLAADNLGSGQYTAVVEPISGYSIQYVGADGKARNDADNGGEIHLTKIPNTGDGERMPLYLLTGIVSVCLAAVLGRWKNE